MRRPWFVAVVWLGILGIGCWYAIHTTRVHTQLAQLLPSDGSPTQQLLVDHIRRGATSRILLIALNGPDKKSLAQASRQLAEQLRESGHFTYVHNGDSLPSMEEYSQLFDYRYVLSSDNIAERFTPSSLKHALTARVQELASPLPAFLKSQIPSDPTGEFRKILTTWIPKHSLNRHDGVWFSMNWQNALLVTQTTESGFDLDAQEIIQQSIKDAVSHLEKSTISAPPLHVQMTGPAVFAVESRKTIKGEAQRLSSIATVLVILFLLLAYRSLTLVGLSLVPLATGIISGILAVNFAFDFIHGITLAFGATLIGVAIDYPIHLFSHSTRDTSPFAVAQHIWPILRLGAITTALGYCAMLFSGFPGLSQLGLFAIVGLLTAVGTTRWILPFLVPSSFHGRPNSSFLIKAVNVFQYFSISLPILLIVSIGALFLSDKPLWENDIAKLSPIPLHLQQFDADLRNQMGIPALRDVLLVTGQSEEDLLQKTEKLEPTLRKLVDQKTISGYDSIVHYLPSSQTQRHRQAALPDSQVLESYLKIAQQNLPFKPGVFAPFLEAVEKAKRLPPLQSQKFQGSRLEAKIQSLLTKHEEGWMGVIPLQAVTDRAQLGMALAEVPPSDFYYLDLKEASNQMVTTYRDEVLQFLSFGVGAIIIVLLLGLRSLVKVFRVFIPVGSSILTVIALLHALEEPLSLFHLASLLLVIGIGLDYSLFFNRDYHSQLEPSQTILAIAVCSLTTITVFGILALSEAPVLHSIGITAALGSLFCLTFSAMMAKPSWEAG